MKRVLLDSKQTTGLKMRCSKKEKLLLSQSHLTIKLMVYLLGFFFLDSNIQKSPFDHWGN